MSEYTDEELREGRERVQRGIDWLDVEVPNWRSRIEPGRFTFHNHFACVFGQVFGSFIVGMYKLQATTASLSIRSCWRPCAYYGFDANPRIGSQRDMRLMDKLWRERLQETKEAICETSITPSQEQ